MKLEDIKIGDTVQVTNQPDTIGTVLSKERQEITDKGGSAVFEAVWVSYKNSPRTNYKEQPQNLEYPIPNDETPNNIIGKTLYDKIRAHVQFIDVSDTTKPRPRRNGRLIGVLRKDVIFGDVIAQYHFALVQEYGSDKVIEVYPDSIFFS